MRKDGEQFALLAPARNYYPTQDPMAGPLGRYFEGEATSEIGLRSGAGEDFWAAFQPDLSTLDDDIARGNRQLANLPPDAQGIAILALAEHYAAEPAPRHLPRDRQPAGRLDLDRRPGRARRGDARPVAVGRGPPPGPGRLRGQDRERAGDGATPS